MRASLERETRAKAQTLARQMRKKPECVVQAGKDKPVKIEQQSAVLGVIHLFLPKHRPGSMTALSRD
jgi:hypothetical protein